ncbi:probable Assembly factor cbp4 [Rhynchosporium agropyri]|uniref:Cytochrome b mRNA-processing protein 4 n=1 Tax=Rhynchosporium agropyri TaxID=914238 RepID=A0A1E1KEY6_9HELO|nr:probable Assembly factor cbp4 [Rhynchosporium agropyri]
MPPKPKPTNWAMWGKMLAAGGICCIGGPALVIWVSPTEEELFLKYNPELQKRSLENRVQKQEDFDHFAMKLREYSKSDRPIWVAAGQDERKTRDGKIAEQAKLVEEMRKRKEEMRNDGIKPVPGGSL